MNDIHAYLNELTQAATIERLWDMHFARMAQYGFDRIMYGFTHYMTPSSLGDPQDLILLTNHHPDYVQEFVDNGLYFHAPMVQWARENDGAASWSLLRDLECSDTVSEATRKVLDFNQKMGVLAGYTISFKAISARSKGAIALTARADVSQDDVDELWARHGEDIVLMNNVAHLKIISLPYISARKLTDRQREVLEWVGDGKTTQDIAMLMGLTGATVEKHLRLARQALDVDTTAQAVLKAAFQNQMFVLER